MVVEGNFCRTRLQLSRCKLQGFIRLLLSAVQDSKRHKCSQPETNYGPHQREHYVNKAGAPVEIASRTGTLTIAGNFRSISKYCSPKRMRISGAPPVKNRRMPHKEVTPAREGAAPSSFASKICQPSRSSSKNYRQMKELVDRWIEPRHGVIQSALGAQPVLKASRELVTVHLFTY